MKNLNLQDLFLDQVRKERVFVQVCLLDGLQLRGLIANFDSFTILLDCDGKQTMVYKHAISTIIPIREVKFFNCDNIKFKDIIKETSK